MIHTFDCSLRAGAGGVWEWCGQMAVDLTAVTAAHAARGGVATAICGPGYVWEPIRCDFEAFLALWRAAKGHS